MKKKTENKDQDLPGYPHYPASEDILNTSGNETERVSVDIENISRSVDSNTTIKKAGKPKKISPKGNPVDNEDNILGPEDESDLTPEDLQALGSDDLSMDGGDDELLKDGLYPVIGDADLDIPGAELDDDEEMLGSEDEENNYYSLGGDKD